MVCPDQPDKDSFVCGPPYCHHPARSVRVIHPSTPAAACGPMVCPDKPGKDSFLAVPPYCHHPARSVRVIHPSTPVAACGPMVCPDKPGKDSFACGPHLLSSPGAQRPGDPSLNTRCRLRPDGLPGQAGQRQLRLRPTYCHHPARSVRVIHPSARQCMCDSPDAQFRFLESLNSHVA
jgi:hypothetical protein